MPRTVQFRRQPRGMLLLLVLLMLSLFMAAGAMLLTIATRARAVARAAAAASQPTALRDEAARAALDEALLCLLRGAATGTNGSVLASGTYCESLLIDKYGSSLSGTGTLLSSVDTPVPTLQLTATGAGFMTQTGASSRLNGRILTIKPKPGEGEIVSFRLLNAVSLSDTTATCYLAQLPARRPRLLVSSTATFDVIVNGREFTPASGTTTPEAYDGYDDANRWLAQPTLDNLQTGSFARLSFAGANATGTPSVDNDNDGTLDGVWLSGTVPPSTLATSGTLPGTVIPSRPSPLGGEIHYDVSYLVLDLDGRINVNAAGMAAPAPGSYNGMGPSDVPIGLGYGPADVDASLVVAGTLPTAGGTSAFTGSGGKWPANLSWGAIVRTGSTALSQTSSPSQRRPPAALGQMWGRYGPNEDPGMPGDDADLNQVTSLGDYPLVIAGPNAVGDLKGHVKAYMAAPAPGEITPRLVYFRPDSSDDANDDPYEVRLDADAPRFGTVRRPVASGRNDDSPYTLGELEAILRPFDADAPQIPQRLASALNDRAQRCRFLVTTESWDTPALTGTAARLVDDFMATLPVHDATVWKTGSFTATTWQSGSNTMSPDVAAGLRFDINRKVASGTTPPARFAQHQYCKGLYTLALALSGTSPPPNDAVKQRCAQWAVNVLDFRDDDSAMTGFEYDNDPSNGWNVDGNLATNDNPERRVVWGVERPEIVITEAAAWRKDPTNPANIPPLSQVFVSLHQPPWRAELVTTATTLRVEAIAPSLQVQGPAAGDGLDLARTGTSTSGTSPVWQLRFSSPTTAGVVQFVTASIPAGMTQHVVSGSAPGGGMAVTSGPSPTIVRPSSGSAVLGSGSTVTICSSGPQPHFRAAGPSLVVPGFEFPPTAISGTVQLQRLADPGRPNAIDNPYVTVESATIGPIADLAAPKPLPLTKMLRKLPRDYPPADRLRAFWRREFKPDADPSLGSAATQVTSADPVAWFHWPNRPFVSQAELALVPSDDAASLLANYSFPTTSLASGTSAATAAMLEATRVPSRFAGNSLAISGSPVADVGFGQLALGFSKWREPGRVNVNTIVGGSATLTHLSPPGPATFDDVVWCTLVGGTEVALTSGTVRVNPFTLAAVSGSASPATSLVEMTSLAPPSPQQGGGSQQNAALPGVPFRPFTSGVAPRANNPFFAHDLPIRLANTATVRSNVFAVWISVRIADDSPVAGAPITKRLFAIVDRSIPVGLSPGENLNVRDCIRLVRYLD